MSQEFRYIVRIAGKDLQGTKKVAAALADLKGIGFNLANYILAALKIDPKVRLGSLSDLQIAEIERSVKDLPRLNLPPHLFNKQKDLESGAYRHLIGSDLDFAIKNRIEMEKNLQSWRGIRHFLGLKVRGQRTRTTGRKGRTIGVRKVKQVPGAAPQLGAKEEKK